jgi:hypothetical protein
VASGEQEKKDLTQRTQRAEHEGHGGEEVQKFKVEEFKEMGRKQV